MAAGHACLSVVPVCERVCLQVRLSLMLQMFELLNITGSVCLPLRSLASKVVNATSSVVVCPCPPALAQPSSISGISQRKPRHHMAD